jgi:hypothetical protein
MNKNLGFIGSSVDPTKVSMTVTGTITFCSALIISAAAHYGFAITDVQVVELASQAGKAVGEVLVLTGLIRKLAVFVSGLFVK